MPATTPDYAHLYQLAERLGLLLQASQQRLAVAESCTGGWLAQAITAVAGSSAWFERGFITYSDVAKQEMLGVSKTTLQTFGAVSRETVLAMAEGALRYSHADLTLSITGIAGPDGGSVDKPVGLVWFGGAGKELKTWSIEQHFGGDRTAVRAAAVQFALQKLLELLPLSLN